MNLNNPKVSIIIPIYNTGEYIEECLFSLINQSLKEIEIIIVNDGSVDNSLEIIENIASTDARIKIYSKKNEGPSQARNLGLTKASGTYVYFMDSDDILDTEALEVCYNRSIRNKLDFILFDSITFENSSEEPLQEYFSKSEYIKPNSVYSGYNILEALIPVNLYKSSVWLYLVKKEVIDNIKLKFHPGVIHEDELYSAILYLNAKRVEYIPKAYYKRRIREGSLISNTFQISDVESYIVIIDELKKLHKTSSNLHKDIIERLYIYILNPMVYKACNFKLKDRWQTYKLCSKNNCKRYITMRNLLLLFFPFLRAVKARIKST